nr:immunoglobulin heavy chain junction region [Mus musculus]NSM08334.1 immunoglobulin heavy chain junction region [Mus musculus]
CARFGITTARYAMDYW